MYGKVNFGQHGIASSLAKYPISLILKHGKTTINSKNAYNPNHLGRLPGSNRGFIHKEREMP